MIHSITADKATFRRVTLKPGFNVILADRTSTSNAKDSRNGLGKTSLLEIIHFCLGSSPSKGHLLRAPALHDWTFTLELDVGGERLHVSRNTARPSTVSIRGPSGARALKVSEWTDRLGKELFGLGEPERGRHYLPGFRELLSYFIRRGAHAYTHPFEHFPKQPEWSKQVCVSFLLGLAWQDASDWQSLRDKKKLLDNLKRAANTGLMGEALGTRGELEAERVRLAELVDETRAQLRDFRVHPQYRQLEVEASELTRKIHALSNDNVTDQGLLQLYTAAVNQEQEPPEDELVRLYAAATVELPGAVKQRLEDLRKFHAHLIENRRRFLAQEMELLQEQLTKRQEQIKELTAERATRLEVLCTHGALEEYTALQQRLGELSERLTRVMSQLASLRQFEEGSASLKTDTQRLYRRAQADYDERGAIRERAIRLFNRHTEALYNAPGRLVINVSEKAGFQFQVEIERSGAQGVESMKVFCFDLTVAQLWAGRGHQPGFLIHDSTLFDPVDSRQRTSALQTAARESRSSGFQYLCTLNSDQVPSPLFDTGFNLDEFVRLRLTDKTPEGSLFGIRF